MSRIFATKFRKASEIFIGGPEKANLKKFTNELGCYVELVNDSPESDVEPDSDVYVLTRALRDVNDDKEIEPRGRGRLWKRV